MKKKLKDVISKEFKGLWGTDFSDDGIPVIKTNNMTYEGRIDFSDICVRNIPYKEAENNFLKKGDLIIEKSGGTKTHSVGYANIFEGEDDKYVCNNFILPLRPNTELVFPKYLFWQLHGMYEAGRFSDCYNKTTGIQNLQKKTYFSKDINLPSKEEQIKIAVHLDKIQSAIDNKKQQLALLDEAVKSEFVEMFGNKNFPTQKWDSVFITKTGKLDSNAMVEGGKYPFFTCAKEIFSIDNYAFDQEALLLAGNNAAGKYDVKYYKGKFNAYQRTYVLSLKEAWSYRLFQFQLEDKLLYLKEQSKGINTKFLTLKILQELEFIIPPKELQLKFETFVQQIDKSKFVVKQQIADLQALWDSKMQEYFSEGL